MEWEEQLVNLLACGGVYALTALGYTLVFGVVRLVNFAHCDVMMLGAYAGWMLRRQWDAPLWLVLLGAAGLCALAGAGLERVVYRPLFAGREEYLLVAAVGASLVLEYAAAGIWGSAPRRLALPELEGTAAIGGTVVPKGALLVFGLCMLCMAGLSLFLRFSPVGMAMRAVSEDSMAARLCGIPEERMVGMAFLLGSALAGVSGVLYAQLYSLTPFMGTLPGMKAFAAAVLGGIGSIPGAVAGGFLLSFFETGAALLLGPGARDGVSFFAMILTLLLFPGGLAGRGKGGERL